MASRAGSDLVGVAIFAGRSRLRGYRWRDPQGHVWSFSTYDLPKEVFSNAHDGRRSWLPPHAAVLGVIILAVAVVLHWNYPAIDFYRSDRVSESKQLREDVVYRAEERETQSQLVRDREATEILLHNIREQWKQLRAAREAAELTATEIEREDARQQWAVPQILARTSRAEPAHQGRKALLATRRKVSEAAKREAQEAKRAPEKMAPKIKQKKARAAR